MGSRKAIQCVSNFKQGRYDLMAETDDVTQRIIKLEERVNYLEKKFNINSNASEVLFPKIAKVVDAEVNTTKGDK